MGTWPLGPRQPLGAELLQVRKERPGELTDLPVVTQVGWPDPKAHAFNMNRFPPGCIRSNLFKPFLPFLWSLVPKQKASLLMSSPPCISIPYCFAILHPWQPGHPDAFSWHPPSFYPQVSVILCWDQCHLLPLSTIQAPRFIYSEAPHVD